MRLEFLGNAVIFFAAAFAVLDKNVNASTVGLSLTYVNPPLFVNSMPDHVSEHVSERVSYHVFLMYSTMCPSMCLVMMCPNVCQNTCETACLIRTYLALSFHRPQPTLSLTVSQSVSQFIKLRLIEVIDFILYAAPSVPLQLELTHPCNHNNRRYAVHPGTQCL
jgi:hypothetical protein